LPRARPEDLPRFDPSWEFVAGGAGSPQNGTTAFNATAGLQRHFYRFGKVAAGADMTRDGQLALGVYGGYEARHRAFQRPRAVRQERCGAIRDPDVPPLLFSDTHEDAERAMTCS